MNSPKRRCVVCRVSQKRDLMISFTTNTKKRELWIESLSQGRHDIRMCLEKRLTSVLPYLCASHFGTDDFLPQGSRKPDAVPKGQVIIDTMEMDYANGHDQYEEEESTGIPSDNMESTSEYVQPASSVSTNNANLAGDVLRYQGFLVETECLMQLLKRCPFCGEKCDIDSKLDGACLKVKRLCGCVDGMSIPIWSSSTVIHTQAKGSKETLQRMNLDLCTSTLSAGNTFKGMERFFETMEIPYISESTYHRHKKMYVRYAGDPVNLFGDGQFDSRGYSAFVCRYIIMESKFNFILNATLMRKARGESSAKLEPATHRMALNKVVGELKKRNGTSVPVKTFTSDRHKTKAITMMNEFPEIGHKFDAWHFFRNVTMDLLKESSICTTQFSIITGCAHPPISSGSRTAYLDSKAPKDMKAIRRLSAILTAGKRLEDIESVSPVFGTSQIESANSLHMMYANKALYFSPGGFELRSKLSMIHWNSLKMDEKVHNVRDVVGTKKRYCKTRNEVVQKNVKDAPSNLWRVELKLKARRIRQGMENSPKMEQGEVDPTSDDEMEPTSSSIHDTSCDPAEPAELLRDVGTELDLADEQCDSDASEEL